MAMQKSLFHKDSRHLTTANAYVSGRRGRRPLQGWRVRFRCRVAISNPPINQNLKPQLRFRGVSLQLSIPFIPIVRTPIYYM